MISARGRETGGLTRIDEVIIETYDRLQKLSGDDKSEYVGTPSGFGALDTILTGLNKSDLILVAARPVWERPPSPEYRHQCGSALGQEGGGLFAGNEQGACWWD